jgi:hypothetical protein
MAITIITVNNCKITVNRLITVITVELGYFIGKKEQKNKQTSFFCILQLLDNTVLAKFLHKLFKP